MYYPFDYRYSIIKPDSSGSVEEQLSDCLNKVVTTVGEWNGQTVPVRINLFFQASDDLNCIILSKIIKETGILADIKIDPTIIAQSPTDGSIFQIALTGITGLDRKDVLYKTIDGNSYVDIKIRNQHWVFLGASGCSSSDENISDSAEHSFKQVSRILSEEGLSFSNIVRQWNYIPGIVDVQLDGENETQNYQEFNEVRGLYYRENGLNKDFPSATGIGTVGQVVRLEIIACKTGPEYKLISIQNPEQQNAHEYSPDQLVGTIRKSTPLFERGKIIIGENGGYIWVSGTAAIKGEESIAGNIIEQTDITCENIDRLVDQDNIIRSGLDEDKGYDISPVYIRAYVKYGEDGPLVKEYLLSKYSGAIVHVLEADVCRKELLVEVEAEFKITNVSIR